MKCIYSSTAFLMRDYLCITLCIYFSETSVCVLYTPKAFNGVTWLTLTGDEWCGSKDGSQSKNRLLCGDRTLNHPLNKALPLSIV